MRGAMWTTKIEFCTMSEHVRALWTTKTSDGNRSAAFLPNEGIFLRVLHYDEFLEPGGLVLHLVAILLFKNISIPVASPQHADPE